MRQMSVQQSAGSWSADVADGADWEWISVFHRPSFICDHLRNLWTTASLYACDRVRLNLAEALAQFLHETL